MSTTKKKILMNIFFIILVTNVFANEVKVKALDLKQLKGINQLSIKTLGNVALNPELKINGKQIELFIPNAEVKNKLYKKIGDVNLTALQVDRSTVKIVVTNNNLSLQGKENEVNVTLKDGSVDLSFPASDWSQKVARVPGVKNENPIVDIANPEADKLDENYLKNLENEHEKLVAAKHVEPDTNKIDVAKKESKEKSNVLDGVKLTQASVSKIATNPKNDSNEKGESSFSVASYVGKFVAFLSLMLLGFYGVLTMFKKGIIKKGKLGFLHSTKLVEVLSTTHIAPKRSLLMVKAHKQIFLISTSETGVQLISEIADVAGLIKSGEEEVTGSNFDTNLRSANQSEKSFKLKNIDDANAYSSLDEMLNEEENDDQIIQTNAAKAIVKNPVKDSVRFSEQIKSKVKNLKQLS